ncbi:MAG: DUF2961 domain-containing protein [Fimbriimonadaceae bacterium]|nr:DUF2961 domain-containing protein [Fimbriimonadaceae bacterium]
MIVATLCCLMGLAHPLQASVVTTGSLFEEMVDLEALTRFPNPSYRTVQFSSYDRRSKTPGGPDWFANSDGFGGEPIPNFEKVLKEPDANGVGEYLMADVEGSGAIVRLWTAAIAGRLRVYIDDMTKPLYEGEADPFFRRPYHAFPQVKAIDEGRFGRTVYQRDASYAPIPFGRRLRIVWVGNLKEIHFYHINVREYEGAARVASFAPEDIERYHETIDRVTQTLAEPEGGQVGDSTKPMQADLAPGETKELLSLEGPGAIRDFWLRLGADHLDAALRQTVLKISCDGFPRGQVQCPVGDFFGAAPGINPYRSLPFSVDPDGRMSCRFVMPFAKTLRMTVTNLGTQTVHVAGEAHPTPYVWDESSMHFRAGWRVGNDLVASNVDVQDLPFLIARGKGIYVGSTSILLNPSPIPTPAGDWWGEGDEKVFVDDDVRPSTFGTGSEDYYNYSWSSPDIFTFPYCGQPRNDGPGNRGFVADYRWHILDGIPFARSIDFRMELKSHERTPGMSYARTGYFYARPGTLDDVPDIQPDDVRELHPPVWQPAARGAARNSQFYEADRVVGGANTSIRSGAIWSDGQALVWKPQAIGERKMVKLPVAMTGKYRVHVTAGLDPSSGLVSMWLDGHPAGPPKPVLLDLFDPYRTLSRTFSLDPADLTAGEHTVVLEYRGANPKVSHPEITLDFFWVQSAG